MLPKPSVVPPLDPGFRPAALAHRTSGDSCLIGVHRKDGTGVRHTLRLSGDPALDAVLVERTVKFLVWQVGGHSITIAGPEDAYRRVAADYSQEGRRAFDYELIAVKVFEQPFEVKYVGAEKVPPTKLSPQSTGRHLEGCRIGFDLGASDRKVAAVIDGETVFTNETVWQPSTNTDPEYHYHEIKSAIEEARAQMPKLDAIGGSSAGVIVNDRAMVASIFRGVAKADYHRVRDVFLRLKQEYGVPLAVANDGDVTALAGSMSLDEGRILGVAMGSSLAGGYVDSNGSITGWLNELAFTPIDYRKDAPEDEWSKDVGCGVQYLSQQAVFRLAQSVGIDLSGTEVLAEKLEIAQELLEKGDERAVQIWQTVGVYFGYAVAHFASFYDLGHVLVLGRVTSGRGGEIILSKAKEVLATDFSGLPVAVSLPDEKSRRVGQAVAAASLPALA